MVNKLYFGDNLAVLREHVADELVDLVYLDPPFNSAAGYNLLFKAPEGTDSPAQIEAFDDTWHWGEHAEQAFDEVMTSGNTDAADLLRAMRSFLGENDMMAYLAMMSVRLVELHRVLKPTGSLYLHCDPTASHYLKLLLDGTFGARMFRNEVIWKRTFAHGSAARWGDVHDTVLFYTKSDKSTWNRVIQAHDDDYVDVKYRFNDDRGRYRLVVLTAPGVRHGPSGMAWRDYDPTAAGRHWAVPQKALSCLVDEGVTIPDDLHGQLDTLYANDFIRFPSKRDGTTGVPEFKLYLSGGQSIQDIVTDIPPLNSQARERLGYPTQKPVALLERILQASSNPGDVVLDPFCGCGTTVHAAQKLERQWIGIDVTHLAVSLIERRLKAAFPGVAFEVHGTPRDLAGARDLAERDKYQFQWWAVSLVDAQPYGGKKKGSDGGIDGIIYFKPDGRRTERAIVSVKGGENVNVAMVRDLKGTIEREKAPIAIFITLVPPTKPMIAEAASAGFYDCGDYGKFPRVQIFTVAELLAGSKPRIPLVDVQAAFKSAVKEDTSARRQGALDV